jgi:HAD superfamily hydrolase (TIGR01509 family)
MITVFPETKGLIFDCDGTLADSMPLHIEAWCEAFAAVGENCPRELIISLQGMPAEKIVDAFNQKFNRNINARQVARDKNNRAREKLREAKPIVPVVNIVRNFRGKLPMAVVSGSTRENVSLIIDIIGLTNHFDAVITSDDHINPKPSPDIFLEAARRLNVDPRYCQVFEDGDVGLKAAHIAGMIATDVRLYI